MSKFSIMKPIDTAVYNNIEKLKEGSEYQKFLDNYNSWEDKSQNLFKAAILFVIVLIPLLCILAFTLFNFSKKSDLALKEDIIETGNIILSTSVSAKAKARKYFSKSITTKSDFERQISSALPRQGIDASKILIGEFSSDEVDGVNEIRAQLKFTGISSQNLFGLFTTLGIRQKMKVEQINIKKNKVTNLLEGTLAILHFSPILLEEVQ